ncbi:MULTISPECIES: ATP-binding protein [unclassified Thiocapsa]|uniref:ATP-binding protein n=1 Tax=unclassified Thiocapsa TaxID=2641286 RepID=UPI0035AE9F40
MSKNEALMLDALVELANLRERDERMRKSSEAIARALQDLGDSDDWEHGPERLLVNLSQALGVDDIVLCSLDAPLLPFTTPNPNPDLLTCTQSAPWLDYLAKRPRRVLADPSALNEALNLTLPLSGLKCLLSGRVDVGEDRFLLVCAETDDRRHLLGPDQQDLFHRFLPIFAQALRRRADGLRARESAQRERALAIAKEAAEQASGAKSDFVSHMSHELRTPLNAVIGFAELLQSEPLSAQQQHYVDLIAVSGKHLMDLINAVLDIAKIEAGGVTLERIDFDLQETIESVRSIVLERAVAKGLNFLIDMPPNLPMHIVGDPTRLRQILINLITNGIKFTEAGTVELRITNNNGELGFHIRDTGIGMDAATLAQLFKPFTQADDSITRKYGGTGLGLIISKELVQAMGGSLEVESAVGVGTCFHFHLPRQEAPRDSDRPSKNVCPDHLAPDQSPLSERVGGRILLVDDNPINQKIGAAMLGRLELEFALADDGRHALERLASDSYALVLMDMEMPILDGLTATRAIRERERERGQPRLPIIAMTANAMSEDRARCFDAGMDGYIAKPMSLDAIDSEIRRLFPQRH